MNQNSQLSKASQVDLISPKEIYFTPSIYQSQLALVYLAKVFMSASPYIHHFFVIIYRRCLCFHASKLPLQLYEMPPLSVWNIPLLRYLGITSSYKVVIANV